jgi:hypothetical protein
MSHNLNLIISICFPHSDNEKANDSSEDNGIYCDEESSSLEETAHNSVIENQVLFRPPEYKLPSREHTTSTSSNSNTKSGQSLPDTVTLLEGTHGSKVYLVGTAHFSEKSQRDVEEVSQSLSQVNLILSCHQRLTCSIIYSTAFLLDNQKDATQYSCS